MTPTFEELLDDLIAAARSTPGFGDPDTTDIEDAKKACMAFFHSTPVVVSTDGRYGDDEFVAVVSFARDMSLRTEIRADINYNGGMCECCRGGDSLDDLENDEDQLLLDLAVHIDADHPDIAAFKERVRAHREEVHARMAARAQEVRESVQERNEPGPDNIPQAAFSTPVLDALRARKRDRKP